jgi:hypothetical protein
MIVQTQSWQKVTEFYRDITEKKLLLPPDDGTRRANRSLEICKRPLPLDFNAHSVH